VEAMLHANELDPAVVSMARVAKLEENVAWWETGQKYASMVTEIGDQFIWYLVTRGLISKVVQPALGKIGPGLGLKIPAVPAGQGAGLMESFGNVIKGYFNPLRNIIVVQEFRQRGMARGMARLTNEVGFEFFETTLREDWLPRIMDPQVADRLASIIANLTEHAFDTMVEAASERTGQTSEQIAADEDYAQLKEDPLYALAKLIEEAKKNAPPPSDDVDTALSDKTLFARHRARRLLTAGVEAEEAGKTVRKAEADTEEAAVTGKKPRPEDEPGAPKRKRTPEETKRVNWLRRKRVELQTKPLTAEMLTRILTEIGLDTDMLRRVIEGKADPTEAEAIIEKAGTLMRVFYITRTHSQLKSVIKSKDGWPDDDTRLKHRLIMDLARRLIVQDSFSYINRALLASDDAALGTLKKFADALWAKKHPEDAKAGKKPPTDSLTAAQLKAIFQHMVVFPTGSAGAMDENGEYRPIDSDIDITAVIFSKVTPEQRVAFEFFFQAAFCTRSGRGLNDVYDVSHMVDRMVKFAGSELGMQSPKMIVETLAKAKGIKLADAVKQIEAAEQDLIRTWPTRNATRPPAATPAWCSSPASASTCTSSTKTATW
ncbi:hypothetical protein HQ576_09505, partial [bacterium]|nr:hypothetical protein [bacterium]